MSAELGRRELLRLGLFGGLALSAGSSLALLSGCSSATAPAEGFRHLRAKDLELLAPLVPVVMGSALSADDDPGQSLRAIDDLLASVSPGGRKPFFQLLDLLQLGPARWYFTGRWAAFHEQTPDELRETLDAWGRSDSGFARVARMAVIQPITMTWYLQPDKARITGYPGPPERTV